MNNLQGKIEEAAQAVKSAEAIFITAGSGINVDSGLIKSQNYSKSLISKLIKTTDNIDHPIWFEKAPEKAWAYYGYLLNTFRQTKPHQGFYKLLELAEKKEFGYFIYTSNVDGQFQKAEFDDAFIEECHGSIHHFQCTRPCSSEIWDAMQEKVNVDLEIFEATGELPKCPNCGGIARPNILMFGDWNWISHRSNEQGNRLQKWLETINSLDAKLTIIEIGAGHAVPTVRLQSQRVSRSIKSTLIRINPKDFDVCEGAIGLPFGAIEGVNKILEKT